jgi:uncharacterized glyoxalase superfamily protein PhnB
MADDWMIVGESGVTGKRDFLTLVTSGDLRHEMMAGKVKSVRVYGDVAVVIARGTNSGHYNGQPFSSDEWITDVFEMREGRWQCVLTHLTPAVDHGKEAKKMEIPKGHQTIMPYFVVEDARAFRNFIETVFNAKLTYEGIAADGSIGHCEAQIGNSTIMFAGSGGPWTPRTSDLFVYVDDADDVYMKALKSGATTILPPEDKDYGRSCGVNDPFGNGWWITSITGTTERESSNPPVAVA